MRLAWYGVGVGALLVVVMSVLTALSARTYKFRGGLVQGVVGLMGSGKSLMVIAKVLIPVARSLSSKHGLWCSTTQRRVRRIIANFECDLGFAGVEVVQLRGEDLWDHLLELADEFAGDVPLPRPYVHRETGELVTHGRAPALDALIVIDEAHLYVTSDKMKLSPKARYVCSMLRKLNAELWWLSQDQMQVHVALRRHTSMVWTVHHCAALWTLLTGGPSRWHVGLAWPMQNGTRRNAAKPLQTVRYRRSARVMAAYNSFALIVPADEAGTDLSRDALSARRLRSVPAYIRQGDPLPPPAPLSADG